jgi:REP element-mobilizing transposase RayT
MATQPRYRYRRKLPHIQAEKPIFVSFNTHHRESLAESLRGIVLECCMKADSITIHLHACVVMPNHVHLLFTALHDENGWPFTLPDIMGRMKSAAAHRINKALGRSGRVWQEESFDHLPRSDESLESKVDYIRMNPVRAGLVQRWQDYPWLYIAENVRK